MTREDEGPEPTEPTAPDEAAEPAAPEPDAEAETQTEESSTTGDRPCSRCGETVPADASVCPWCGTLQPPRRSMTAPAVAARTIRPMGPIRPTAPVAPRSVPASRPTDNTPPRPPARRRSRRGGIALTIIVLLLVAGGIAAAVTIDRNRDDEGSATSDDPRVAAVEEFCQDPGPLTEPKGIAEFAPGKGAVAYIEVPQPASSTTSGEAVVAQVSPSVGNPNLQLDESINLVSLAVCVEQTGSSKTDLVCKYELTNADDAGKEAEAPLLQTKYRISIIELATGKTLTKGTLETPADQCPKTAYVDGKGVSQEIGQEAVLAWVTFNFAGGQPS